MPSLEEILQGLRDSQTSLDETSPYLKVMIYGNSGMGKTVTAMRLAQKILPAGKRIAYVDAVEGWVSAKNHPEWHLTRNTARFQYQGYSQLQVLAQAIEAKVEGFEDFGVLILDEFSTMSKRDLDVVLKARSAKDPTKDKDAPTQPDFYANTERMRKLIVGQDDSPGLLQLPMHVIVIAHERIDKNDIGQEAISPDFMPKFSKIIKENLHVIARMTNELVKNGDEEEIARIIQAFPYRRIDAKTRIKGLGELLDVETFCGILAEWTGEEAEVSVPVDENVESDSIDGEDDDTFGGIVPQ